MGPGDDIHRPAVFTNFAERPAPIPPGSARISRAESVLVLVPSVPGRAVGA